MRILETAGLTRRFGNLTAVDGLGLTVAESEIFGLLIPNGAGKTTVIKMLTTSLPPFCAAIWFGTRCRCGPHGRPRIPGRWRRARGKTVAIRCHYLTGRQDMIF